jgi:hypothetical protein
LSTLRNCLVLALATAWLSGTAHAQCVPVTHAADDYRALSAFWGTTFPLCRLADGVGNAFADRSKAIVMADQAWLDRIATQYGPWAATGILAHEWGHMVQGLVQGTAAELQADCLAGVFMKGAGLSWQTVEQFAAVNWNEGGDPYWTPSGHGTSEQRMLAARRGYYGYYGQTGPALVALCPLSAF